MNCDLQTILDDAKCFMAIRGPVLNALAVNLWCSISESIAAGGGTVTDPHLKSDDLNWYEVSALDLGGGDGTVSVDQVATTAGPNVYLVLLNIDDGLKYKFRLVGSPPDVFWSIDAAPTLEAETPTILTDGATSFSLKIVAGPTVILV